MRDVIDAVLTTNGSTASRSALLQRVTRAQLDDEIRRGHLVAIFPRTYARPWEADQATVIERAALLSVGGETALSHVSALEKVGLIQPAAGRPLHVTAFQPRHPRGVRGRLVVHRTLLPLRARYAEGLPVVEPAKALVTSWPLLDAAEARAAVIEASRRRLASAAALTEVAQQSYWVRGIAEFRNLVGLLVAGCESELEIWGLLHVFDVDGLRHARRQRVLHVGSKTYRADLAFEEERVLVELDGHAHHSGFAQRERDLSRDAALAGVGWLTVRFSFARLTTDPDGCRRQLLAVLDSRSRLAS